MARTEFGIEELIIEDMSVRDIDQTVAMIQRIFDLYIAPEFSEHGIREFKCFIRPQDIRTRYANGSVLLVGRWRGELVGVIEIKGDNHIALLFTEEGFHRKGIAGKLIEAAVARCRVKLPGLRRITVNSSPFAVRIYKKMGFIPMDCEQQQYGIKFTPMEKILK